jgi:phosphoribosylamine--glycine ligase
MGAYAPAGSLPGNQLEEVGRTVIAPTLAELRRRRMPFRGALYAGLMLTSEGPRVLEFNVRFGDPETQPLMMQLEEDLVPLLAACAAGRLEPRPLAVRGGASVGVVLAAEGYPQSPRSGDVIEGLDAPTDAQIFHAGTRAEEGRIVTAGGRVLTVCARGGTLAEARQRAYAAASRVHFRGIHYRRDIASR